MLELNSGAIWLEQRDHGCLDYKPGTYCDVSSSCRGDDAMQNVARALPRFTDTFEGNQMAPLSTN